MHFKPLLIDFQFQNICSNLAFCGTTWGSSLQSRKSTTRHGHPTIQKDREIVRCGYSGALSLPKITKPFRAEDLSRIIEMAWEDRTPFEAIDANFGLNEGSVIQIMRSHLNSSAFKSWRKRVSSRKTKHLHLRPKAVSRGYCSTQYKHR